MKKRIGITGASGFIGKLLVQQLLDQGYSVNALMRSKTSFPTDVKRVEGDLTDIKALNSFLQDIDILIHLAGRQLPPEEQFFKDNVLATNALLNRAKNFPIKHLIFLSTVAVYADQEDKIHTEEEQCNPSTYYGLTKYLAENICHYWQTITKQKLTILRPFNVYGKENRKGVVFTMIENAKKTQTITINGDGNQIRDFLYVDDVINALLLVIQKEQEGIFNLGSGHSITISELADMIKELSFQVQTKYKQSESGKTKKILYALEHTQKVLGWHAQTPLREGIKKIL